LTRLITALAIAAAAALPWATYKDLRSGHVTRLTAAGLGVAIVAAALVAVALTLLLWARDSVPLRRASVLVGVVTVCLCVATALSRISAANHLASHASPGSGSQTAFAFGAAVAVVAAAALTLASAVSY
jgi:hypothetical protein